jgi:excisionase family DNA binding protein
MNSTSASNERPEQTEIIRSDDAEYLTLDEVVRVLPLAKGTLYRYTSKGQIPHYKVGGRLVFDKEEIHAWIRGCAKGARQ